MPAPIREAHGVHCHSPAPDTFHATMVGVLGAMHRSFPNHGDEMFVRFLRRSGFTQEHAVSFLRETTGQITYSWP